MSWFTKKKTKNYTDIENENGEKKRLLTVTGKCKQYKADVTSGTYGKGHPNAGEKLTPWSAGYRRGYRAALGEQSKIYKKKNGGVKP